MKFAATLERDEDGVWIAECPSTPGGVSQGQTRDEALSNVKEAIALCLKVRAENGMPLTVETRQLVGETRTISVSVIPSLSRDQLPPHLRKDQPGCT